MRRAPARDGVPALGGLVAGAQVLAAGLAGARVAATVGLCAFVVADGDVAPGVRRGDGGEVAWTKPAPDTEAAAEAPLPPGWTEHMSRSKGVKYYKRGEEVSWERPTT